MKSIKTTMITLAAAVFLVGCATVAGTIVGTGIGAMMGDAELGATVGMTAGAVQDIFGR